MRMRPWCACEHSNFSIKSMFSSVETVLGRPGAWLLSLELHRGTIPFFGWMVLSNLESQPAYFFVIILNDYFIFIWKSILSWSRYTHFERVVLICRWTGVTVKMHSPKIVLPSNYLPGNKNSPVFFSQEIITPRSIYLLVKYHSLQEIWTPL